jgi:hypothetical protein
MISQDFSSISPSFQKQKSRTNKTPVPANSPLLTQVAKVGFFSFSNFISFQPSGWKLSSTPSYSKTVRRARSFRAGREKVEKEMAEVGPDLRGQEVTFLIRRSMSGRIGWKIIPEDETLNLRMNCGCVEQVMQRIR